jgi:hypothetical protein
MERTLHDLHARQRKHGDVQPEIDVYLVACIEPSLQRFVLPRHCVPHYDNLPDLSTYALGILDPSMDSDPELQQALLLLRQCTPLRRRTKRAQREVQWRLESFAAMQTLVRCLQGTLLGLYPNSLKATAFGARVGLLRFLRTLVVQPFERLHGCLQRIAYIVKLGVMEHLCNTIYDYHPGICHTLNRSGQKIEHFCNSVSTICDIFRGELNTLFCCAASASDDPTEIVLEQLLPHLERIAHSYFERCTRAYRGIIVSNVQTPRAIDHVRRLMTPDMTPEVLGRLLDGLYTACSQGVFDSVRQPHPTREKKEELAWYLSQVIQVHPLPDCIMARQKEALMRRFHGDTSCIQRCRMLHVCMLCLIRRGTANGTRLRHDCITGQLACMQCGPALVLTIDTLGRIVTLGNQRVLLSGCCANFIFYTGSGHEFAETCGPLHCGAGYRVHHRRERGNGGTPTSSTPIRPGGGGTGRDGVPPPPEGGRRKRRRGGNALTITTVATASNSNDHEEDDGGGGGSRRQSCFMCQLRTGTAQRLAVLDPYRRRMRWLGLCAKHLVPRHITEHIFDEAGLLQFFARQRATLSSGSRGGAGGARRSSAR